METPENVPAGRGRGNSGLAWLADGWDFYAGMLPRLVPAILAVPLLSVPVYFLADRFGSVWPAYAWMTAVIIPIEAGVALFYIKAARGRESLRDIFYGFSIYFRALAFTLIFSMMLLGGFMLLIVPGILIMLAYSFGEYALVDENLPVRECFLRSAAITQGHRTDLLPVLGLMVLIEVFAPSMIDLGSVKAPSVTFKTGFWDVAGHALKNFVFIPWLNCAAAIAYCRLKDRADRPRLTAADDAGEEAEDQEPPAEE
ncbi:MAG: hypothetical protein FD189_829 [Elusimicrobia bacterium]|nr:MAG: hypothetical protein FD154_822 [Elusimicrobiota bacterium]KAF0156856.1 MAG: hypothetical protein FD189_829 [Elusimicrobiota bacterium]